MTKKNDFPKRRRIPEQPDSAHVCANLSPSLYAVDYLLTAGHAAHASRRETHPWMNIATRLGITLALIGLSLFGGCRLLSTGA